MLVVWGHMASTEIFKRIVLILVKLSSAASVHWSSAWSIWSIMLSFLLVQELQQTLHGDDMPQEWNAFVKVDLEAGIIKTLKNGLQVLAMHFLPSFQFPELMLYTVEFWVMVGEAHSAISHADIVFFSKHGPCRSFPPKRGA